MFTPNKGGFCEAKDGRVFNLFQRNFLGDKKSVAFATLFLVGAGGFGPPKSLTTDLQSAPFGHSGTLPFYKFRIFRCGIWSW